MNIPSASRIEADLVSAAAFGPTSFHAACFAKLAALELDAEDRAAIVDMIMEESEGFDKTADWTDFATPAIAAGAVLAPMAFEGSKYLAGQSAYEGGWDRLHQHAPDVVSEDPVRAKAVYDLLHSTAPSVAGNTPIAADVMRQIMSMPSTDIGTIGGLADIGKSMSGMRKDAPGASALGVAAKGIEGAGTANDAVDRFYKLDALLRGKTASVAHVSSDGVPCLINWATPACKAAGLTDAFTPSFSGNGTTMDQANAASGFEQQAGGQSMLPLDAVVRELIAKEMELSQREQILQQQEMAMQQASQMQGQIGQQYQGMTGVDPSTGQPAEDQGAGGQDPGAMGAPPEGQDPGAMGAPEGQDPAAMGAPQAPEGQDPAAMGAPQAPEGQDPAAMGAPPEAQDPAAMGAPQAPEGQDPAAPQAPEGQDPSAMGAPPAAQAPEGQDPAAAPADNAAPGDAASLGGGAADGAPVQEPGAEPAAGDPAAEGEAQDPNAGMGDAQPEAGAPEDGAAPADAGAPAGMPPAGASAPAGMPPAAAPAMAPMAMPQGSCMTVPLPPLQIHVSFAPMT